MADTSRPGLGIGHPAPLQHRVSHPLLFLAILAGPTLWLTQLLAGFAFSSYLCFAGAPRPSGAAVPGWLEPLLVSLNIAAVMLSLAALAAGWRMLVRTADEHQARSGDVVDAGEGRTRFLATWALVVSALFAVASLFNTINLVLVPQCLS